MAALDQLRHLPEEKGEQQRADVRAVDVRIRHDDDLVVAQIVGGGLLAPDAGAERGDQRADLLAGEHLVETRALDVEDLSAQREHRLELAVAALLGRAAGGIPLDDEELGFRRIALLAVSELAGQRGDVERAFAARELARLARRLARGRGLDHLADDRLGLRGMLLEPGLESFVDHALDYGPHLGGHELVLGLRGELRVRDLHGEHRGQTLAAVVARERDFVALGDPAYLRIAGDLAGERAAETGEVRAAVALRNVVGEAEHGLVIAVVPGQRRLDRDAVALRLEHDRHWDQRGLVAVEIFDEGLDPALVAHLLALLDRMALVRE